jgi:molecular chaperone GrpE
VLKSKQKKEEAAGPAPAASNGSPTPPTEPAEPALQPEPQPQPAASQPPPLPPVALVDERLLRLQADFDNLRKRIERERAEMTVRATQGLIAELLPALDHLEYALAAAVQHKADPTMIEGFRLVSEQFFAVLGKFGLTPVDAVGDPFDPHVHEAVTVQPSMDVPEHAVMAQTRRGYRLGNLLLRPVQVIVSSGPPVAAASPPAPTDAPPAPAKE